MQVAPLADALDRMVARNAPHVGQRIPARAPTDAGHPAAPLSAAPQYLDDVGAGVGDHPGHLHAVPAGSLAHHVTVERVEDALVGQLQAETVQGCRQERWARDAVKPGGSPRAVCICRPRHPCVLHVHAPLGTRLQRAEARATHCSPLCQPSATRHARPLALPYIPAASRTARTCPWPPGS